MLHAIRQFDIEGEMSFKENWERVTMYMRSAKSFVVLKEDDDAEFESWLERNELELAWDALYDNAIIQSPGSVYERRFLLRMLQAATLMMLNDPKINKVYERLR